MAERIVLPQLGASLESAVLLEWRVAVGDAVQAGEPLCEIETDKASVEIESSASGVLLARLAEAGDEIPVMSVIAWIGEAGEALPETGRPRAIPASSQQPSSDAPLEASVKPERLRISPRARRLAERKSLDPRRLQGSGPGGRVIERDIEAALRRGLKVTPVAQAMLDSGDFQLAADQPTPARVKKADLVRKTAGRQIPLRGARKTIARRMRQSLQTTAQFTLQAKADARPALAWRRRLKASDESLGLRDVTVNDLLLFAVARTLPAFPALNALLEEDTIYQQEAVNLCLAVDGERALLTPVIRDAASLSLRALSAEARRLAEKCRAGDIAPADLSGGSFTVSNLGALGIESFTPILNPPQVAILGAGAIELKPLEEEGEIVFAPHIGLSLTIDHQAVDGAPAARFLGQLRRNLAAIDLLALAE